MRLDQWLWAVRVFKTRTLSTEAIKNEADRVERRSFRIIPGIVHVAKSCGHGGEG